MNSLTVSKAELTAIVAEAVAAAVKATPAPQSFDQCGAIAYVGLPRSTWFRLRSAGELPDPVNVTGSGARWRRADLDKWLARLKPRRANRRS